MWGHHLQDWGSALRVLKSTERPPTHPVPRGALVHMAAPGLPDGVRGAGRLGASLSCTHPPPCASAHARCVQWVLGWSQDL